MVHGDIASLHNTLAGALRSRSMRAARAATSWEKLANHLKNDNGITGNELAQLLRAYYMYAFATRLYQPQEACNALQFCLDYVRDVITPVHKALLLANLGDCWRRAQSYADANACLSEAILLLNNHNPAPIIHATAQLLREQARFVHGTPKEAEQALLNLLGLKPVFYLEPERCGAHTIILQLMLSATYCRLGDRKKGAVRALSAVHRAKVLFGPQHSDDPRLRGVLDAQRIVADGLPMKLPCTPAAIVLPLIDPL